MQFNFFQAFFFSSFIWRKWSKIFRFLFVNFTCYKTVSVCNIFLKLFSINFSLYFQLFSYLKQAISFIFSDKFCTGSEALLILIVIIYLFITNKNVFCLFALYKAVMLLRRQVKLHGKKNGICAVKSQIPFCILSSSMPFPLRTPAGYSFALPG